MKLIRLKTTAILLFVTLAASGQSDSLKNIIREQYTIAGDNMGFEYFEKALPSLHWMLKNAPGFSASVQSWAIEAFEKVAENTQDKSKKQILLDSMIIAYKSKAEHFELTDLDKNKLAFRYFRYFLNDPEKLQEAYPLFKSIFETPESVINNNLIPYIYVSVNYHEKVAQIEEDEILQLYMTVSELVSNRYSDDEKRFKDYTERLDNSLLKMMGSPLPCEAIDRIALGMDKIDSLNSAKKVMSFSLNSSCGRTANYMKALNIIANNEPTSGVYKILAQYAAAEKNWDEAIGNYEKALSYETSNKKKSDLYMDLATVHYANYNKPKARESALLAIETNPEESAAAYSFIGNLYMASFDECSDRHDIVQDKAVYLAAYDMFEKAKDTKGMEDAQLRFPTREEAFQIELYDGEPIEVGCWIQVKTILRTRPSN